MGITPCLLVAGTALLPPPLMRWALDTGDNLVFIGGNGISAMGAGTEGTALRGGVVATRSNQVIFWLTNSIDIASPTPLTFHMMVYVSHHRINSVPNI